MIIKATQLQELIGIIKRAQLNCHEDYYQWHEDAREVLKDTQELFEQDPPPAPPQPVPVRTAVQIAPVYDAYIKGTRMFVLCNDGVVLQAGTAPWGQDWGKCPPIPQD